MVTQPLCQKPGTKTYSPSSRLALLLPVITTQVLPEANKNHDHETRDCAFWAPHRGVCDGYAGRAAVRQARGRCRLPVFALAAEQAAAPALRRRESGREIGGGEPGSAVLGGAAAVGATAVRGAAVGGAAVGGAAVRGAAVGGAAVGGAAVRGAAVRGAAVRGAAVRGAAVRGAAVRATAVRAAAVRAAAVRA